MNNEVQEGMQRETQTGQKHSSVPPVFSQSTGQARKSSPSPSLKSLVLGMWKNILQKSFPSPFPQILSKNTSSVSIVLEQPTLHPTQTTHLFPVLICKHFRDFFLSFMLPPPFFFTVGQAECQANSIFQPLETSQGQNLPNSFFLFASVTNKHSHFITQTHRRVRLHTETGFSICFCFSNLWFRFFSFLQKMQTKEKQVFN